MCKYDELPEEMLMEIMKFLDGFDAITYSRVNKFHKKAFEQYQKFLANPKGGAAHSTRALRKPQVFCSE